MAGLSGEINPIGNGSPAPLDLTLSFVQRMWYSLSCHKVGCFDMGLFGPHWDGVLNCGRHMKGSFWQ